jgi:hypothetical protein
MVGCVFTSRDRATLRRPRTLHRCAAPARHQDPRLDRSGPDRRRSPAGAEGRRCLGARPANRVGQQPLTRARKSIEPLSDATGLPVLIDDRVREWMEFDPSSHAAALRLHNAVVDHAAAGGLVVILNHGWGDGRPSTNRCRLSGSNRSGLAWGHPKRSLDHPRRRTPPARPAPKRARQASPW